jgi:hypothetical protein
VDTFPPETAEQFIRHHAKDDSEYLTGDIPVDGFPDIATSAGVHSAPNGPFGSMALR